MHGHAVFDITYNGIESKSRNLFSDTDEMAEARRMNRVDFVMEFLRMKSRCKSVTVTVDLLA